MGSERILEGQEYFQGFPTCAAQHDARACLYVEAKKGRNESSEKEAPPVVEFGTRVVDKEGHTCE